MEKDKKIENSDNSGETPPSGVLRLSRRVRLALGRERTESLSRLIKEALRDAGLRMPQTPENVTPPIERKDISK